MECSKFHEDFPSSGLLGGHSTAALGAAPACPTFSRLMAAFIAVTVSSHAGRSQSSTCFCMKDLGRLGNFLSAMILDGLDGFALVVLSYSCDRLAFQSDHLLCVLRFPRLGELFLPISSVVRLS